MPLKLQLLLKAMRYWYSDLVSFMEDGYIFKKNGATVEVVNEPCKNCYGKWYSTLYRWDLIWSPDFIWDEYIKISNAKIIKIPCKWCKEKEYTEFKKKELF